MSKIYVVGDLMTDVDRFFETTKMSPEGFYPVVALQREERRPGGAGAVSEMLTAFGVHHILLHPKKRVCLKQRFFFDGKQQFRWDEDDTIPILSSEAERLVNEIEKDSIVLVSDYGKGTITSHFMRLLVKRGVKILVDPARNRDLSFYNGAYAIIPNRYEARIDDFDSLRESIIAAKEKHNELAAHFPHVCIKLDRHGMLINGDWFDVAQKDIVDVCGAGDMVLAAIGMQLAEGKSFLEAAVFANIKAGEVCMVQGARYVPKS